LPSPQDRHARTGSLVEYCLTALALVLAIVKRSDGQKGFVVLPKRWIVEPALYTLAGSGQPVCSGH
jgi:hypothetical protein